MVSEAGVKTQYSSIRGISADVSVSAGSLVATIVLCVMPTAYIWLFRKFEAHEDSKSDAYKASNTNHEKKSGGASRILHNLFMVAFPLLFLIVLSGVLAWLAIR